MIAVDGTRGIIGSANLTLAGGRHNLELAVLVEGYLVTEAEAQVESWIARSRRVNADWIEQMRFRVDAASARSVEVALCIAKDLEGPDLGPSDAPPNTEQRRSDKGDPQDASSQAFSVESSANTPTLEDSVETQANRYLDLPLPQQWISPLRGLHLSRHAQQREAGRTP